ncbi:MAG TPA: antibiotic biosynthesis monooxygenase family protein [Allosphingosinicella sp.]|uniref:putative quinol monooxygenase n=1 Tax=Allosphingosinicella sp. TaxID=2823234 RepID=UPI002ED7D69E
MIVEHIRYVLTDHKPEDVIAGYEAAAEHLQAAPECLGYELTQCVEEPNVFLLTTRWTSAGDHMQGFRRGPNFPPFLAAIRPFVGEIAEMRHYRQTDLVWQR